MLFLTDDWIRLFNAEVGAHHVANAQIVCLELRDAPQGIVSRHAFDVCTSPPSLRFVASGDATAELEAKARLQLAYRDAAALLLGTADMRGQLVEAQSVEFFGSVQLILDMDMAQKDAALRAALDVVIGETTNYHVLTSNLMSEEIVLSRSDVDHDTLRSQVSDFRSEWPATYAYLEDVAITRSPGVQAYVSHRGDPWEYASGSARPGIEMALDSLPTWICASKPLTAAALLCLWEAGIVDIEQPVSNYLPEFGQRGKEGVRIIDLLTHQGPFSTREDPLSAKFSGSYEERLRIVYEAVPAQVPGRSNYAFFWAWLILAEIIGTYSGSTYRDFVTTRVLEPCGLTDTFLYVPDDEYEKWAPRFGVLHDPITTSSDPARPRFVMYDRGSCITPIPGANVRGPMRDLGRFYEALLRNLHEDGPIMRRTTAAAMVGRCRVGVEEAPGHYLDYGLGLALESRYMGPDSTQFAEAASLRTFGHQGLQSTISFADRDNDLVVAIHLNGQVDHFEHRERCMAVGDAVYRDLARRNAHNLRRDSNVRANA